MSPRLKNAHPALHHWTVDTLSGERPVFGDATCARRSSVSSVCFEFRVSTVAWIVSQQNIVDFAAGCFRSLQASSLVYFMKKHGEINAKLFF